MNGMTWSHLKLLIAAKNNSQLFMVPIIKVLLQKPDNLKKHFERTNGRTGETDEVTWSQLELLIADKMLDFPLGRGRGVRIDQCSSIPKLW